MLAAGSAALVCVAPAAATTSPTAVTVTIANTSIVFTPRDVPTGTLVFTVINRTTGVRDFGVGARRTGAIAAGRSTRLTLSLPARGERTFSSVATAGSHSKGRAARLTGALYLFEPCTHPAVTTVDVRMATAAAGGLTLSQTSVPCGTVTFDVTDVDASGASFVVSAEVPPLSAGTVQLEPGATATLTVRFAARAVIDCDAVANDTDGYSVVVGYVSLTLL